MSEPRPPRPIGELPALRRAERAAALIGEHGAALRRTAMRFSQRPEDAEDAVQRAAEILIRKGPELGSPQLLAWMRVVVRHEAFAVGREARRQPFAGSVPAGSGLDPGRSTPSAAEPERAIESTERVADAAAALATLKPQERRALGLQAAGCSYAEIQAITGWTYTKVNRSLAEGRAALARREPLSGAV